MPVNYALLRSLTARELMPALRRDGFLLDRQAGGHMLYRHPDMRRVTVSYHSPGETFAVKTLKSMIEDQARWTEEDLRRLKLIR